MKRKLVSILLCAALSIGSMAGCSSGSAQVPAGSEPAGSTAQSADASVSKDGFTIGMTVNELTNQIFASTCENLDKMVKEAGGTLTYLECKSNASTQITQIENFISSGVDCIIIQPAEATAIDNALKQAMDAGIKVFCWDEDIQNADICWLIDNYDLGKKIGAAAADWINSQCGGSAEVAVLNYPQLEILVQRGKGIEDAIKEQAPNAKIVATASAITATQGMDATETILQAHPDLKVIACIGGGGATGANEAVKASGKLTDDFGVFAADCTQEEMAAMANHESNRGSVMITGDGKAIAAEIFSWAQKLLNGESVEKKIYRDTFLVNQDNLSQYYIAQ